MPAPDWEDLTVFLQADEFAVTATVALQDGTTRLVVGIFDDPFLNAQLGEYELDTARPRLTCRATDVEGVTRGDTATIDGEVFDVMTGPQGDGTGMATLDLARRVE
jgi:hypothetical protein